MAQRLYLLDGMAIAYRSYYAFINRPLINSKGQNTSSIYGFVNFLNKILEEQTPDYIAVVFDTAEPTFRHKAYDQYKATRQRMPEDMSVMMEPLKEVVRAFNIPVIELPGYEADDIIGTLARRAEKNGVESFLVSGDKDFLQLVTSKTKILRPGKQGEADEIIDEDGVIERFGVPPHLVIDILGLTGDTSDNVPGIPGVGPKTATPLVQKFGTIENIYEHLDEIPQKGLQQKFREHKDKAYLSKGLVTIDINVPVEIDFHTLKAKEKNIPKLLEYYESLGFQSLAKKLKSSAVEDLPRQVEDSPFVSLTDINQRNHSYIIIDNDRVYREFLKILLQSDSFVFDTETTSTNPLMADLVGLSFSFTPAEAYYVPVHISRESADEPGTLFTSQEKNTSPVPRYGIELKKLIKDIKPVFENPAVKKFGQNIKYDILVLARNGIWTDGVSFDTMVASYILRTDGKHSLDALAKEYLAYKMVSFDELTDSGKKDIRDIPTEIVGNYSSEDADITRTLCDILHDKLNVQGMKSLCTSIEFPLISVLAEMEFTGISIDIKHLDGMSRELERQINGLSRTIIDLAGEQFNINSTQQLSVILFDKFKLTPVRKTKTGFSTDVGVLEALRKDHPIVESLLEYRQLSKLKSTYVDALPKLIHPGTGRVHTSFNQTVTSTGRLSSSDPNLQNIPIRSDIGRQIRRAFVPGGTGMAILSADYSQIELRVMAHISGDEGLQEAFRQGEDVHTSTAAKVFGVAAGEVTKEMRRKAKEVNFGIMYGIGAFGLASRLDIAQFEAKEIINKYFERFPGVNRYIADTIARVRRDGYVTTLLDRRRFLPDIHSKNQNIRSNAERQAINMPIQGTAADMIKLAMIKIAAELKNEKLRSKMLLQVHDELVFEVFANEESQMRELIAECMKNALPLSVPLQVDIGLGDNWLEAH